MVAVLAEDEPTADHERRQAEGDDAMVWGETVTPTRLRLLDLIVGGLRTVDGLADRHVVEGRATSTSFSRARSVRCRKSKTYGSLVSS